MSQENVEIVRAMYGAFNEDDPDRALAYLHPETELHQNPEMPDTDSYYGIAEFERGIRLWLDAWETCKFDIEDAGDLPDERVLLQIRVRGIAKSSAIEIELPNVFHIWTVKDGKPQRCEVYSTRKRALNAVGLSE